MNSNGRKRQLSECSLSENIKRLICDERMKENIPPELIHSYNKEDTNYDNGCKNTTPKKSHQNCEDPVTPNTNFKLLTSLAANLDYANCNTPKSRKNSEAFDGQVSCGSDIADLTSVKINRKEKSLSIICTRFLAMFPTYPLSNEKIIVSLDEACFKLGVERRRLYDIVNVFESIDMLSKNAKNQYLWFGKNNLLHSLLKLKEQAINENIVEKLQYVLKSECMPNCRQSCMLSEVENFNKKFESPDSAPFSTQVPSLEVRKEKSLGIMSQKFLMLFLVSPDKVINLGVAAKVLNGFLQRNEKVAQVKTQIRRLYDIANVLSSIGLIEKHTSLIHHVRKPAFKYVGPNLQNPKDHFSSNILNKKPEKARSFVRHSSFQDICAVAEIEHQKLNLRESPKSAPPFENSLIKLEDSKTNFENITFNSSNTSKTYGKVAHEKKVSPIPKKSPLTNPQPSISNTVPCIVLNNVLTGNSEIKYSTSSAIPTVFLINTIAPSKEIKVEPSDNPVSNNDSQTIILSPEQRDAILRSLNISLSPQQIASIHLDGGSQSSNSSVSSNMLKIVNKNSASKNLEHKIAPKCMELTTSRTNTRNNSPISGQAIDSPLSIPSGYATPIPSVGSDISFVSNTEVNDILKKIESHQNMNSISGSNQNLKMTTNESFVSERCIRNDSSLQTVDAKGKLISNQSPVTNSIKDTKFTPVQLILNDSCSSDSVNLEVSNIFKGKNLGESFPKSEAFLIDEKTILSPIKKPNISSNAAIPPNLITPPYIIPDTIFVFSTPSGSYQPTKFSNPSNITKIIVPNSIPLVPERKGNKSLQIGKNLSRKEINNIS